MKMRRFENASDKVNVILSVFEEGERLRGKDIVERLRKKGYKVKHAHLRMFIYYNMLHKYLKKEKKNGTNYYSLN